VRNSYVRRGVRYGRFQTHGSAWGPGKVHLYIYRKSEKEWVTSCRFNDIGSFGGYYGMQMDDPHTPVTCKKCLKAVPDE
jgi:hypothetical protein